MESPMFYKGGLRGKKLPVAGKIEYKSIPIQDLESLVMLLASDLDRHFKSPVIILSTKVQPVGVESDPGGWQGVPGGERKDETFGPPEKLLG